MTSVRLEFILLEMHALFGGRCAGVRARNHVVYRNHWKLIWGVFFFLLEVLYLNVHKGGRGSGDEQASSLPKAFGVHLWQPSLNTFVCRGKHYRFGIE